MHQTPVPLSVKAHPVYGGANLDWRAVGEKFALIRRRMCVARFDSSKLDSGGRHGSGEATADRSVRRSVSCLCGGSRWCNGYVMAAIAAGRYCPATPGFQLCGEDGKPSPTGSNICSPAQGSAPWLKWYKNRLGTEPMDPGSVAMDFDEVFSFKSLPAWWRAMNPSPPELLQTPSPVRFNQYTGAPIPGSGH